MLRKTICTFSLFFILTGIGLCAEEKSGKTTKEAIIRIDATVFSDELGKVPKDSLLEIIEEKYGWYKIRTPQEFSGFVYSSYIEVINENKGISKADNLNIRSGPSVKTPVIGRLNKQDEIKIIAEQDGWHKIAVYPYGHAWVHKNSMELTAKEEAKKEDIQVNIDRDIRDAMQEMAQQSKQELLKEYQWRWGPPTQPDEPQAVEQRESGQTKETKKKSSSSLETARLQDSPTASGILIKSGGLFTSVNYKLKNEDFTIYLRIPSSVKTRKLLNKKVVVWGTFQEDRGYLVVEKILEEEKVKDCIDKILQERRKDKTHTKTPELQE